MSLKEAFEVMTFDKIQEQEWILRGRAYEDIKQGEELICELSNGARIELKVTNILLYKRTASEINSGLTGELTVLIQEGKDLMDLKMLYKTAAE